MKYNILKQVLLILWLVTSFNGMAQKRNPAIQAIFLEDSSWTVAQTFLTPNAVVVIPLGAQSKEHGPHLPLATDFIQATALANEVALNRKVIIAPTINYGFYPAFLQYPGSTSINFVTATELVVQIVRSIAAYGPRRFYIINVGVSTTPTLVLAAKTLAEEGILLYFSRYDRPSFDQAEAAFRTQAFSGHADEIETANVLSVRSDLVFMHKAVNDSSNKGKTGIMSPRVMDGGILNTSGINGYAALGTKEKGIKSMHAFAQELIREIDSITHCALPAALDPSAEYTGYEGTYVTATGKQLLISQKNKLLYFIWDGKDARNFFHLYKDATDAFSSMSLNILFVRDDTGTVQKAYCRYRGENFWAVKSK